MTQKNGAASGENDDDLIDENEWGEEAEGSEAPEWDDQPKDKIDRRKKYHKDMTNVNKVVSNLSKEVQDLKKSKASGDDYADVDLDKWDPENVKMVKKVVSQTMKGRVEALPDTDYEITDTDEKELDAFYDKHPDAYDQNDRIIAYKKKFPDLSFNKIYKNFIAEDDDGAAPKKKTTSAWSPNWATQTEKKGWSEANKSGGGKTDGGAKKTYSEKELADSAKRMMGVRE